MSITTSTGERYDALENFLGGTPNEYVDSSFGAMSNPPLPRPKPISPITDPNISAPTQKGDWESEVITDFPPMKTPESNASYMQMYKDQVNRKRRMYEIEDLLGLAPQNIGTKVIPGEEDWTRTKDLGKPVVISENK